MRVKFIDGSNSFIFIEGDTLEECMQYAMENMKHAPCSHEIVGNSEQKTTTAIDLAVSIPEEYGLVKSEIDRD